MSICFHFIDWFLARVSSPVSVFLTYDDPPRLSNTIAMKLLRSGGGDLIGPLTYRRRSLLMCTNNALLNRYRLQPI